VAQNRIRWNGRGLLFEAAAGFGANEIADNGVGLEYLGATPLNIANQWWGDPTGPYEPAGNPFGLGDEIVVGGAGVNYSPWLGAPPAPCN
jgi:hypothetical protein